MLSDSFSGASHSVPIGATSVPYRKPPKGCWAKAPIAIEQKIRLKTVFFIRDSLDLIKLETNQMGVVFTHSQKPHPHYPLQM